MAPSGDLIFRTQALFAHVTNQDLSQEEARECTANLGSFFKLLNDWQRNAQDGRNSKIPPTTPVSPSPSQSEIRTENLTIEEEAAPLYEVFAAKERK